ncbi:MAG TPA: serine--tRNA ligase [Gemmatales bacterium]|nr:serine--tRNA ligase [Gemmatales bacterium]HMP59356.1 serine--tRNA ligase [Gemmatales bacterium]
MLDAQFVYDHLDEIKTNCRHRNVKVDLDGLRPLYEEKKQLSRDLQALQTRQNELAKATGKEKDPGQRQRLIEEGRQLREQAQQLEAKQRENDQALKQVLLTIPNLSHPDAPVGTTAADNKVIKSWGTPPPFSFKPLDHVTLAEKLDLVDFEAGAAVAGQKFYFLKRAAALLEIALVQFAMQHLVRAGFIPVITPDLARAEVLEGIGFIPRGPETQIYSIENSDLCLVATAEITLGGMHRDQILEQARLPLRYVGLSHCFRTEAGAPGRDTRGLYRVHQFTKVEMFVFCTPDQSGAEHETLLRLEEEIFQALGLPYQVIDTCTGDLGGPAYRKYDLEAWMPGRGTAGEFGEVTSTSNCTDFQARRLGIRYKGPDFKGTRFVHTLNGTAVAVSRALVALLENGQQADGTVMVPDVLRPWVGVDRIVPPG